MAETFAETINWAESRIAMSRVSPIVVDDRRFSDLPSDELRKLWREYYERGGHHWYMNGAAGDAFFFWGYMEMIDAEMARRGDPIT